MSLKSSISLAKLLIAEGATPQEETAQSEQMQAIASAISELSLQDGEILIFRVIEKLNYRDIGLILGITTETARQRFGRALMKLQKKLR